jgi:hypothetical protein
VKTLIIGSILAGLALTGTMAEAETFGNWETGEWKENGGGVFAMTKNDSGVRLGAFCWPGGTCEWRVTLKSECAVNTEYPMLAATANGAAHVTLRCLGKLRSVDVYRYNFIDDDRAFEIIAGGSKGTVGFVVPQEGGEFRITRFSLAGVQSALTELIRLKEKLPAPPVGQTSQGTKDTLL